MKTYFFIIILSLISIITFSQTSKIDSLKQVYENAQSASQKEVAGINLFHEIIADAYKNLEIKNYKLSASLFEQSFLLIPWERIDPKCFYDAATAWSLAGNKENAFKNLFKDRSLWKNLEQLKIDENFICLHNEDDWKTLLKKNTELYKSRKESFLWGMFLGIILILFIYNLFLFISVKEVSFLYYSLFIFFSLIMHAFRIEDLSVFLSKLLPYIGMFDPTFFYFSISTIFFLFFTRSFLNLKEKYKKINKSVIFLLIYLLINSITSLHDFGVPELFWGPYHILALMLYVYLISIYCWKKGDKSAKYFVIANTVYTLGVLISIFKIIGVIKFPYTMYTFFLADQIGSIGLYTLLSFALGNKINLLKKDTIEAQEKALVFLEEKVKERTIEIEQANEEITSQRDEVVKQKEIIEEIHHEISQSIDYAQRLQGSILPDENILKKYLNDHFVLFKPKDKVSGDFYWWAHVESHTIITAADCTGHGVPGAFMSMLGTSFLREIVQKEYITHTGVILRKLRKEIIKSLKQKGEQGEQKDGMDMAIISINHETNVIQFSGAYNPLYIITDRQLDGIESQKDIENFYEIKPDKMPIAIYEKMDNFQTHELLLEKGDLLYMFSDGFADQFGGPKGKKYKYKPFKQMIAENCNKPMNEQKELLNQAFEDWKGTYEQIDDVVVLGIKI